MMIFPGEVVFRISSLCLFLSCCGRCRRSHSPSKHAPVVRYLSWDVAVSRATVKRGKVKGLADLADPIVGRSLPGLS